ncbi:hybrid sensor histidine kinase/response regulator [Mucilaginibacter sp.]
MTPVNILIVDDREENIIALEALIKRDDIKIFSTTSPNDALKIAWENSIAIALVDVQMPEIDGFELVDMLKSNPRTKDIFVIFVTAISKESKYAIRGYGSGAVDYLYKPLDPFITAAKVDSFIQLARYQAEIIRKNEELENYSIVVNNCADVICAVDAQTLRVKTINPTVEKILGYKPDEVVGKNIVDFAIEKDQIELKNKLGEIIKDNVGFSVFEFQFQTFDKSIIWVECRASYHNKTIFINISNISPQKSYLQQLVKSKEIAEHDKKVKETFLANMSHELRTPVNGVLGLTQLLRKTTLTDQQTGILELLESSSQSLLGIINDVLDISKIEAGKFNIVRSVSNLNEIVNSVYKLLKFKADEKLVDLLLEVDPEIPEYLLIDYLRLNQILMNLLSNAIKFTDRGYVKLKITIIDKQQDKVQLRFSVEDTGIGIAANSLSKIFDSFEQAEDDTSNKYGGTGLGLTIVKKLAELKGGELTFSSQVGKGSVFNFTNWYTIASKPKVKDADVDKLMPFNQVNVLVAEDNMVNQFILSKMLKDWKVNVELVDNGRKVIEKLHHDDFDMILMDTHMPEMNGYQTAKTIRIDFDEPKRSIPIISLSAAALDHEKNEAIAAGMNDVLSKPFQPYELHEKMQKLLNLGVEL